MQSTKDQFTEKLKKIVEEENPEVLSKALTLLYKLFQNICNNPTESKYRNIKKQNKLLAEQMFNVTQIPQLLTILGFQYDTQNELYNLPDNQLSNIYQVISELKDQADLLQSMLISEEEYQKQLLLIQQKKNLQQQQEKEQKEIEKLKDLNEKDKQEQKHIKAKDSCAVNRQFGAHVKNAKDMGIQTNKKG